MDRTKLASELVKLAKEIVAVDTFKCPECGTKVLENTGYCVKCKKKVKKAADEWMTAEEVEAVCPCCAEKMRKQKISKVRRSAVEESMEKTAQEKKASKLSDIFEKGVRYLKELAGLFDNPEYKYYVERAKDMQGLSPHVKNPKLFLDLAKEVERMGIKRKREEKSKK
jgi:DNA-directed RNA polymerase subunit RPC12/RpoP